MNAELLKTLLAAGIPAEKAVEMASGGTAPAAAARPENATATTKWSQGTLTITVPAAELAKAGVRSDKGGRMFRYVRVPELGVGFPLYTRAIPGVEAPSK